MKSFIRSIMVLPLLILPFLLAACTDAPFTTTPADATPSPTRPVPSNTIPAAPTRTLQPAVTASAVATTTLQPTPTLVDDISQVTLVAHGVLPNWKYLLTFGFSDTVRGSYRLVVDENKEDSCTTRSDQPSFLYCDGPMAAFDDYVDYELWTIDGSLVILTGKVYIPPEFTP